MAQTTHQTSESTHTPPAGQQAGRSIAFWIFVVVLLTLNTWFDYYHPEGIVFDVVLAAILIKSYYSKSKSA